MSIRSATLALLELGPMHGYQLRSEFEQRTGATWPPNVGQIYTTLSRLVRDGLGEHVSGAGPRPAGSRIARPVFGALPSKGGCTLPPDRCGLIPADEPTGALDTDTGEEIARLLRNRCDAGH